MSNHARLLLSVTALAALAACSTTDQSTNLMTAPGASQSASGNGQAMRLAHQKVCPGAAPGEARCHSWIRVDDAASPLATAGPSGYGPADLRAAYNLAATGGA